MKENPSIGIPPERPFLNNRGRIFLTTFRNFEEEVTDESKMHEDGFPVRCNCDLVGDTLVISAGDGLFSGAGVVSRISRDRFNVSYMEYTTDKKPYVLTKDAEFSSRVEPETRYQFLQLDKKPSFKVGQQLSGYITMTSSIFYKENFYQSLDTCYVNARLKFTCITMSYEQTRRGGKK